VEEKPIAIALKAALEDTLPGLEVWTSSSRDDVPPGSDWNSALAAALRDARAVIALCSLKSVNRLWINFECGFGYAKNRPVVPVCHGGLGRDAVPQPLGRFQALDLREPQIAARSTSVLLLTASFAARPTSTPRSWSTAL
jgi:hypothetical protein